MYVSACRCLCTSSTFEEHQCLHVDQCTHMDYTYTVKCLSCHLHCMLNCIKRNPAAHFVSLMHLKTVSLHSNSKREKEMCVCMFKKTQMDSHTHSLTYTLTVLNQFLYNAVEDVASATEEVCAPGGFCMLPTHFCVARSFLCSEAVLHLILHVWLCVSVSVRPPCHTLSCVESPNSIPDKRKDSWCAYVQLTSVLLQCLASQPLTDEDTILLCLLQKSDAAPCKLTETRHTLNHFAHLVLRECAVSGLCFPFSWASMSIIMLHLDSSLPSRTNYISCSSPGCR